MLRINQDLNLYILFILNVKLMKKSTFPALNDDLLKTLERLGSSSARVSSDEAARDIKDVINGKTNG